MCLRAITNEYATVLKNAWFYGQKISAIFVKKRVKI